MAPFHIALHIFFLSTDVEQNTEENWGLPGPQYRVFESNLENMEGLIFV